MEETEKRVERDVSSSLVRLKGIDPTTSLSQREGCSSLAMTKGNRSHDLSLSTRGIFEFGHD